MTKLDADEVAESHNIPDLVAFLLGTGCRIGEVIALQVEAIDWEARTISISISISITGNVVRVRGVGLVQHSGKTFSARRVLSLPDFLMELLDERGARNASPDALLFPNTQDGWRDPPQHRGTSS